jgi:hypothetical protein
MARRRKSVETLVGEVFHPNSKAGKGIVALAEKYQDENNSQGIAAIKGLLTFLEGKCGVKDFSGTVELEYVYGKRLKRDVTRGACEFCGQRLRYFNNFTVRCKNNDGEIVSRAGMVEGIGATGLTGEMQCGDDHWDALQDISEAIGAKDFSEMIARKQERTERKYDRLKDTFTFKPEVAELMRKMGVDPEHYEMMKQMLEFGPAVIKADKSVIASLEYSSFNKGDINWLLKNKKKLPEEAKKALDNFAHEMQETNDENIGLVFKALYQTKPFGLEALIGGIKSDLLYADELPDEHPLFKSYKKPDLDAELKVPELIKLAKRYRKRTVWQKLKEKLCTRAEALGIMRAAPGLLGARLKHNRAAADSHFTAQEFKDAYDVAVAVYDANREEIAEQHRKEEKINYGMLRDEYSCIKAAQMLVEKSRKDNPRDALIRLLPMPDALNVFNAIAMVAKKHEHGIDQRTRVVSLGYETAEALDKVRYSYGLHHTDVAWRTQSLANALQLAEKGLALADDANRLARMKKKLDECTEPEKEYDRQKLERVKEILQTGFVYGIKGVSDIEGMAGAKYLNKKGMSALAKVHSKIGQKAKYFANPETRKAFEEYKQKCIGKKCWHYYDFSCKIQKDTLEGAPVREEKGARYFSAKLARQEIEKLAAYRTLNEILAADKEWLQKLMKIAGEDAQAVLAKAAKRNIAKDDIDDLIEGISKDGNELIAPGIVTYVNESYELAFAGPEKKACSAFKARYQRGEGYGDFVKALYAQMPDRGKIWEIIFGAAASWQKPGAGFTRFRRYEGRKDSYWSPKNSSRKVNLSERNLSSFVSEGLSQYLADPEQGFRVSEQMRKWIQQDLSEKKHFITDWPAELREFEKLAEKAVLEVGKKYLA